MIYAYCIAPCQPHHRCRRTPTNPNWTPIPTRRLASSVVHTKQANWVFSDIQMEEWETDTMREFVVGSGYLNVHVFARLLTVRSEWSKK